VCINDHLLTVSSAYEIRQGTLEQTEAEREWVLAHYSRTAKKRKLLAGPAGAVAEADDSSKKKRKRSFA
jgi:U3 small nucleolar ribonucleoprotein protein IMP4